LVPCQNVTFFKTTYPFIEFIHLSQNAKFAKIVVYQEKLKGMRNLG
jgi:hypothetical protein